MTSPRSGSVLAFSEAAGLGEVVAPDGTRYPFHCVAVADGTRWVEVGAEVTFVVRPGLLGRWEAFDIRLAGR